MRPRIFPLTLLVAGVAAPIALPFAFHQSFFLGLFATAAMLVAHGTLLYGTLRANNSLFGPVVTHFAPVQADEIWLTIDDGPDPHDTPIILDLLDAAGATATFFVRGDRARSHPELIREIVRRGHGLGNHTDTHPQAVFWGLGPRRMVREVADCQAAVRAITGDAPPFFRAPVGMVNPFVHPATRTHGLTVIGWSARGFDGVSTADPAEVIRRILADLRPGGIALLHEGRRGLTGNAINVDALRGLLDALHSRRWRTVLPVIPGVRP